MYYCNIKCTIVILSVILQYQLKYWNINCNIVTSSVLWLLIIKLINTKRIENGLKQTQDHLLSFIQNLLKIRSHKIFFIPFVSMSDLLFFKVVLPILDYSCPKNLFIDSSPLDMHSNPCFLLVERAIVQS